MSTAEKFDENQIIEIPMDEIFHDEEFNSRGHIIPFDVIELGKNIRAVGLLAPILVEPYTKGPKGTNYRILSGHRRHMAHVVENMPKIRAIVKAGLSEQEARFLNLVENLNRKDLDLLQEAKVLEKFFAEGMTQEEVAKKLGKSRTWVQNRLYALRLPEPIQEDIKKGYIKSEHIHGLQGLPAEEQFEIVKEIKRRKDEGQKRVPMSKAKLKKDPQKSMVRDKHQMAAMREHIILSIGSNFGTRCLAWTEGNIPSAELFEDIKELAREKGITYFPPDEDL